MQTIEEVVSRVARAKVFSTLNANSGYWQLKLDDDSADLCTFNTPFGRYRYLRMPFGVKSAPEIFQGVMTQMLQHFEGVEVVMDDILVRGETTEQHDKRVEAVMKRLRQQNVKQNREKCHLRQSEVKYLGHVLSEGGLKIDPTKVEAVKAMYKPTNKKEMQRYLGMVTYLGKFVPSLSQTTAPLRQLIEKDREWIWQPEHDEAFEKLQRMLTEAPVLQYYDVEKPVVISVDGSKDGIGAVLLQEEKPVAFASKAFTDSENRYAQIEKERKFTVETDHKPLENILKKHLADAPPRLQRMLLRIQKYDLKLQYKIGKELYVADALSRDFIPKSEVDDEQGHEVEVFMIDVLPLSPARIKEIQRETKKDDVLQKLKKVVEDGWSEQRSKVDREIRQYCDYRAELTIEGDLIFKGDRSSFHQR